MSSVPSSSRSTSRGAVSARKRGGRVWGIAGRIGIGVRMPLALLVALCGAVALGAPSAQASVGVERLFAGNCLVENCGETKNPDLAESEEKGARAAGSFVPFGVTQFHMKTHVIQTVPFEAVAPEGYPTGEIPIGGVRNIRTDVAPGVVTNPQAAPMCSQAAFNSIEVAEGIFLESACEPETIIGENIVTNVIKIPPGEPGEGLFANLHLTGHVYNLEPSNGESSLYGVALYTGKEIEIESVKHKLYAHTLIEGNVDWSTDYHDYFVIKNVPPGLIDSRLVFYGNGEYNPGTEEPEGENRTFIRNPTSCNPPGPATTTTLKVESYAGETESVSYEGLVGPNNCNALAPFEPNFLLSPEAKGNDQPTGMTTETTMNHPSKGSELDTSDLNDATVTLPPGMTINPSAAAGLQACTPEQAGVNNRNGTKFEIAPLFHLGCPSGSKIGTATLEVPTLPAGSLTGFVYLGKPESGPITGPPYTVYVITENQRFGVQVRLEGMVEPNPSTGQLTAKFFKQPEAPFTNLSLHFNGGPLAPIANPLTCGEAKTTASFTPYSGIPPTFSPAVAGFIVEGCASSPPPFAAPGLKQSLSVLPSTAGANSSLTMTFERESGQQYLTQINTALPPGLVGIIPSVTQCTEAQASSGACPASSQIGTVSVKSGAGPEPFTFNGTVYLTEKYAGAPYGLLIKVPAVAGPFNLGNILTRATINVNESTAQVSVASTLPTIVGGIPTRIQSISVNITRQGYLRNPTNCGVLASTSSLTGTPSLPAIVGGTATLSSPFQVEGCSSLGFKPKFAASTSAKTSRKNGASLKVTIGQKGSEEANIASVVTTQPFALPSRLSTLQKACTEAQAKANILACPATSNVGEATAVTPTLPNTLKGPAYIVSHGGEAFPDLDLVLQADGVRVILVGNTHIKNGITTTTFNTNPDVPIKSFSLKLPTGPHSLLSANGSFCKKPLEMPTTITGQNGKKVTQKTQIKVNGCLPITHVKVKGTRGVTVSVKIPQAGRVRFSGDDLGIRTLLAHKAKTVTVTLPVTPSGIFRLRHHKVIKTEVRVGFIPSLNHFKGGSRFTSFAKVTIR